LRFLLRKFQVFVVKSGGKSGWPKSATPNASDRRNIERASIDRHFRVETIVRCTIGQDGIDRKLIEIPAQTRNVAPPQLREQTIRRRFKSFGYKNASLGHNRPSPAPGSGLAAHHMVLHPRRPPSPDQNRSKQKLCDVLTKVGSVADCSNYPQLSSHFGQVGQPAVMVALIVATFWESG